MKKLKLFISFLTIISMLSCESDGGTSVIELRTGAVPDIQKLADADPSISYGELLQGGDFNIGVSMTIYWGDVTSADLVGFYTKGDGTVYGPATLSAGITSFPVEATFNKGSIVAAFSELTSVDDLELGDSFTVSAKLYLADGTFINLLDDDSSRLYGSDIHTATQYKLTATWGVVCDFDPELTVGTYVVYSDDWGYPEAEVTFVADPSDPYKLFIWGLAEGEGLPYDYPLEINIDPGNFEITGPKTIIADDLLAWGIDWGAGYFYQAASGLYNSCTGDMVIGMDIGVNIGGWGVNEYVFTRK